MTTTLRAGDRLHGFEILELRPLDELEALGVFARHLKTGAQVFHILNDDDENLFSFAFATTPQDSTGVAHILEHSVLCGSEHHPLKDAFMVLAQGSLQTFLNALTFPDKTVYPASSVNKTDYFNLMTVYGDAVFRPLLSELAFLQEGHRLEFGEDGKAHRVGIVYNEMKGSYSSMDGIAGDAAFRSVLPGTPYEYDSGGDPQVIPSLSWEDLKAFHARYYAPSNCRIFLAGNIPTEEQLAFLDERFLSSATPYPAIPAAPVAPRWEAPRSITVPYPSTPGSSSTVMLSWLCSDVTDHQETMALAALSDVLLGHDGAPLLRALVESGLGEDMAPASGLEAELRETIFVAGLRGVEASDAPKVEALILETLRKIVNDGIVAEELEAALRGMEFSNREIRRAGGPFSLAWMRRSLRGWLHGAQPWTTLLFAEAFDQLKARLASDPRYLEGLIQRYLLDNPHRALISVVPDDGLAERWASLEADAVERDLAALGEAGIIAAKKRAADLSAFQDAEDAPEALASIPHLRRSDLEIKIDTLEHRIQDIGGVPLVSHEIFTNGVSYLDWAFPVDVLDGEDYRYLPLFSRAITSMGLPEMDYGAVSLTLSRLAGGFHSYLQSGARAPGMPALLETPSGALDLVGRDWLVFRLKALDDRLEDAATFASRVIAETDLGDLRRLGDLVAELKNDFLSSLAPSGHAFASGRAGRRFSRSRAAEELWSGLSQLEFSRLLADELPLQDVASRLNAIRAKLLASGVIVHACSGALALDGMTAVAEGLFSSYGAPKGRGEGGASQALLDLVDGGTPGSEAFSSDSLQVGFGALAMEGAPYGSREQAAEIVLSHHLSTGPLMETIRMKGGAYGAFAYPDVMEGVFLMATYRDPVPSRSLDAFRVALEGVASDRLDEEELEKTLVGAYSKETRPRAPIDRAFGDFLRLLYGISDEIRLGKIRNIIDIGHDDIASAAGRLKAAASLGTAAVIAPAAEATAAGRLFGKAVRPIKT